MEACCGTCIWANSVCQHLRRGLQKLWQYNRHLGGWKDKERSKRREGTGVVVIFQACCHEAVGWFVHMAHSEIISHKWLTGQMVCLLGYVCVSWNAWLCTEFPSCRLLNFGSNQSPERGCSTLLARTWLPCCEGTIWPMEKQVFLTHFQKDPFIFRKITSKTSYLCYTPGAQAFALPGMAMDNAAPRGFEHSRALGWPFTIRVLLWSDSPENKDRIWQEREGSYFSCIESRMKKHCLREHDLNFAAWLMTLKKLASPLVSQPPVGVAAGCFNQQYSFERCCKPRQTFVGPEAGADENSWTLQGHGSWTVVGGWISRKLALKHAETVEVEMLCNMTRKKLSLWIILNLDSRRKAVDIIWSTHLWCQAFIGFVSNKDTNDSGGGW